MLLMRVVVLLGAGVGNGMVVVGGGVGMMG